MSRPGLRNKTIGIAHANTTYGISSGDTLVTPHRFFLPRHHLNFRPGSASCLASLIETCRLNGVDPEAYLADVLEKLVNGWPAARINELLPWAQAYAKPAVVPEIKIAA
jgi:hypothetical protein